MYHIESSNSHFLKIFGGNQTARDRLKLKLFSVYAFKMFKDEVITHQRKKRNAALFKNEVITHQRKKCNAALGAKRFVMLACP